MSNQPRNTKRDSKGISAYRDNCGKLQPVLCHVQTAVSTLILNFLDNRWSHSSPVSCFRTDSTSTRADKGQIPSAARIGDGDFRGRSPLLTLLCAHSDSQFSRQPLVAFEPSFVFLDLFNIFNHRQRPKKHCAARIGDGNFKSPAPLLSHVQRP